MTRWVFYLTMQHQGICAALAVFPIYTKEGPSSLHRKYARQGQIGSLTRDGIMLNEYHLISEIYIPLHLSFLLHCLYC